MGIFGVLRNNVNKKIIQDNADLAGALLRNYEIYGRPDSLWKRGALVAKLFFILSILKKDVFELEDKEREKLSFPESTAFPEKKHGQWEKEIGKNYVVVIDIWSVLLINVLDKMQLLSLYECETSSLGCATDFGSIEKLEDKDLFFSILSDFTLVNPYAEVLIERCKKEKRQIYLKNNEEWISDNTVERIINDKGFNYPVINEIPEGAAYISTEEKNCYKSVGRQYRSWIQPSIVSNIFDSIVAANLHTDTCRKSLFYEYGFVCGGILTVGFCQFLDRLAKQENIDKFVFVARDGFIIKEIYDKYYHTTDSAYLVFSRFASLELIFNEDPYEYIDKNIKPRIYRKKTDNSIGTILKECGIGVLNDYLSEDGLLAKDILTEDNYLQLSSCIVRHKNVVAKCFEESQKAAQTYFLDTFGQARKVCVVDLGWRGKSIIYLKKLLEKEYGWNGEVIGALVGAERDPVTQLHIRKSVIFPYLFDTPTLRRKGLKNSIAFPQDEVICVEALFSSEADTLLRYKTSDEGAVDYIYGTSNKNKKKIQDIHSGIKDFCNEFTPLARKYNLTVTASDAGAPLDAAMRNSSYSKLIRNEYLETAGAMNGF